MKMKKYINNILCKWQRKYNSNEIMYENYYMKRETVERSIQWSNILMKMMKWLLKRPSGYHGEN